MRRTRYAEVVLFALVACDGGRASPPTPPDGPAAPSDACNIDYPIDADIYGKACQTAADCEHALPANLVSYCTGSIGSPGLCELVPPCH